MRVLYATDGSAPARDGERLICELFDPKKVTVHALSVTPEAIYIPDALEAGYELDRLHSPLGSAEVARQAAEHLDAAGFTATFSATRGSPAIEILRTLGRRHWDAVVLGSSHTTWVGNLLLGSVSTHVLHHSPCSVLVTHRAPTGSGRVLVGIDGSRQGELSSELATRLLDPSKVRFSVAISVNRGWLTAPVYPPGPVLGSRLEYQKVQTTRIEQAWHVVETAKAELRAKGFEAEGAVLAGSPGPQLLKEADNLNADLVIVGSRGLGPVRRAFLGSVSDQVVRHAPATLVGRSQKESVVREAWRSRVELGVQF